MATTETAAIIMKGPGHNGTKQNLMAFHMLILRIGFVLFCCVLYNKAVIRITAAVILLLTVKITAAVIGDGPVAYCYSYVSSQSTF